MQKQITAIRLLLVYARDTQMTFGNNELNKEWSHERKRIDTHRQAHSKWHNKNQLCKYDIDPENHLRLSFIQWGKINTQKRIDQKTILTIELKEKMKDNKKKTSYNKTELNSFPCSICKRMNKLANILYYLKLHEKNWPSGGHTEPNRHE